MSIQHAPIALAARHLRRSEALRPDRRRGLAGGQRVLLRAPISTRPWATASTSSSIALARRILQAATASPRRRSERSNPAERPHRPHDRAHMRTSSKPNPIGPNTRRMRVPIVAPRIVAFALLCAGVYIAPPALRADAQEPAATRDGDRDRDTSAGAHARIRRHSGAQEPATPTPVESAPATPAAEQTVTPAATAPPTGRARGHARRRARAPARSRRRAHRPNTQSRAGSVEPRASSTPTPATATPAPRSAAIAPATLGRPGVAVPNFFIDRFRIPPFLLPIYQAAGTQYGVRWEVLAAINEIETDYGRNLNVSSAGALGLDAVHARHWKQYGMDANRDGDKDPFNPVDAIFASARYLRAAGAETRSAPGDLRLQPRRLVRRPRAAARACRRRPARPTSSGALTGLRQGRFPVRAPLHLHGGSTASRARRGSTSMPARRAVIAVADATHATRGRAARTVDQRQRRRRAPRESSRKRGAAARLVDRGRLRQPLQLLRHAVGRPRPPSAGAPGGRDEVRPRSDRGAHGAVLGRLGRTRPGTSPTCASRSGRPGAALRGSTRSRSSTAGGCSSRPRSTGATPQPARRQAGSAVDRRDPAHEQGRARPTRARRTGASTSTPAAAATSRPARSTAACSRHSSSSPRPA